MNENSEKNTPNILLKKLPDTIGLDKVRVLADLTVAFREISPERVIEFGKQGLEVLKDTEDIKLEIFLLQEICWACNCIGEYQISLDYGFKALELADDTANDHDEPGTLNKIGAAYYGMAKYDKAIEYFIKSLRIHENIGNEQSIAELNSNIGTICYKLGDNTKAQDYYNRAIRIFEEIDNRDHLDNVYNNAAIIYREQGEYEEALKYHKKALKIREQFGKKWRIPHSLNNIGAVLMDMKNYNSAQEYFFRSLEIAEEIGNRHIIATILISLGEIYALLNHFEEAQKYLMRGLVIADEINEPDHKMECLEVMSTILERKGDFRKALEYHKKYKELYDIIFTEDSSEKYNELQVKYETEKKEKENEIYRLRNIELVNANDELTQALSEVRKLSGLLPICASCKRIRDDSGYWEQIEGYISERSDAQFSHGLCPECLKKLYPEYTDSHD